VIHAVWPFVVWFTENIFREDKEIVEFEQRAYDAQGADWNNEVFPAIRDLRACWRVAANRWSSAPRLLARVPIESTADRHDGGHDEGADHCGVHQHRHAEADPHHLQDRQFGADKAPKTTAMMSPAPVITGATATSPDTVALSLSRSSAYARLIRKSRNSS